MARPIWKGTLSFGLVNIPVTLYSAENRSEELHFHLIDKKNHARIRYERINEATGKEVPWDNITKAYEFEKGNYIEVNDKELEKIAYENSQEVEIEEFVDREAIEALYYDKPYYLVPDKQSSKAYNLLRETLENSQKLGIAKVVIRTRQYLAAVLPFKHFLSLNLLRFEKDIRDIKELMPAESDRKTRQVTKQEIEMAKQLVNSMSVKWNPKKYHDKSRELLMTWINSRIKLGKSVTAKESTKKRKSAALEGETPTPKRGEVIDFMALLKKSIQDKKRAGNTAKTKRPKSSKIHNPITNKLQHKRGYRRSDSKVTSKKTGKKNAK